MPAPSSRYETAKASALAVSSFLLTLVGLIESWDICLMKHKSKMSFVIMAGMTLVLGIMCTRSFLRHAIRG